ncbi:hypothetical protein Tco_0448079 [Tanacetum coccineum]
MQAAQDRQKSYADRKRKPMEFEIGDRVMLKVSPWKGVVRFGKRGKLNPRYVGPFKVLAKVGKVAYRLELPQELSRVHHTFHVSNLKKCYADEPLVMPLEGIHVDDKLQFMEEPVEIIEREIKRLKRSRIPLVKVRWNSRRGPEFTWEREDSFKQKYPQLFTNRASSSTTRFEGVTQQRMKMDMWEIKEKLAERREQMAIRAYEENKRHEEWYQKIKEDKRREEWYQKIEDDKRREAWNQKIEEMINLIDSFIQNPISSVKMPQPVTTKVPAVTTTVSAKPIQNSPCYDDLTSDQNKKITEKGVGKEGFGCALNKSKGSHLGLRHCAANRKRKKRKGGRSMWSEIKVSCCHEVGQTEAKRAA